jgi:hypothetical protein
MRDLQTPTAIRAALQYVLGCELPADHKTVVIEALTQFLRSQESELEREHALERDIHDWEPHELAHLDRAFGGKLAKSWQDADENVTVTAAKLHRRSAEVRAKAIERGFAAAVDFSIAKAQAREEY